MSYNKNRSIVIRNAIINSLFILWCLVWRTGLGLTFFIIYASLGYIYSWPFYLPISIILGFAPWGWKVQEDFITLSQLYAEIIQKSLVVFLTPIVPQLLHVVRSDITLDVKQSVGWRCSKCRLQCIRPGDDTKKLT